MTSVGYWFITLAAAYTVLLIVIGRYAQRRAAGTGGYFVGARSFNAFFVMVCITGLFSGSSFIAILELAYLKGVSAIWYGVAETTQVLLIATLLLAPFRRRLLVTISGLIGDQYGRQARAVAGAITAFAFPMWSVATALAFASALHVFTGLPLMVSVVVTAALLLLYLQFGGMWSVGYTQLVNVIAIFVMLAIGVGAVFVNPGIGGLERLAAIRPELYSPTTVGFQTITAWFGTFIFNVILAQAAFQMALSCKTPAEGKKGLFAAAAVGVPLILGAAFIGLATAYAVPGGKLGLIAVPQYLMHVLPAPLAALFFLGFWACALSWGAPCQFSGATSLGRDVGAAIVPNAGEATYVRYTRWSLVLLTVLMVVFASLRSEQSAWWNILAWVTRNSATFAPVLAALFWPLATRRAVMSSMVAGTITGLGWYYLSGWSLAQFFLHTHPVWPGMIANLGTLAVVTLVERRADLAFVFSWTSTALTVAAVLAATAAFVWAPELYSWSMSGLVIFLAVFALFFAIVIATRRDTASSRVSSPDPEPQYAS